MSTLFHLILLATTLYSPTYGIPLDPAERLLKPRNFINERSKSVLATTTKEPGTPGTSANTGPPIDADLNPSYWGPFNDGTKATEPIRGVDGGTIISSLGNERLEKENADTVAPPSVDHGSVGSSKWPFSMSHMHTAEGGWARTQTVAVLPDAKEMAGVNMRLEAGAYRELHWHAQAEWTYILSGEVTITAVDPEGRNTAETVQMGDIWYFAAGNPHSLQAGPNGAEFVLVFDSGSFSESTTFLLSDWLAHIPKGVLKKNFRQGVESKAFDNVPKENLYIFNAPLPTEDNKVAPSDPYGRVESAFTYRLSKQNKTMEDEAGWVKIVDSRNFPASKKIAAAEVFLQPGAMRELHWHPDSDEWALYITGETRVGIFAAAGNAATLNFSPGDVGYIHGTFPSETIFQLIVSVANILINTPEQFGHYVQCISKEPCRFIEVLKSDTFKDISLSQWLAATPVPVVAQNLRFPEDTIKSFSKTKQMLVAGDPNST